MLLWLSGTENTKWSPNENYARELMELFTLGAGRGYTERDVREQARALTGFDNWKRGGNVNFRFDRKRRDTGAKRIFGKRGAFDWRDAVQLCLVHPKHASFFVTSSGTTSSRSRRTPHAAVARDALPEGLPDPPAVEAILRLPGPLHRAADGEAARRLHRRSPARDRPRDRHDLVGLARLRNRPAALHAAERGRLGRRALARHGDLPRPLVGTPHAQPYSLTDKQAASLPRSRRRLSRQRSVSGAPPHSARPPARPSSPSRTGPWATRTRSGSSRATASSPRTRFAS